MDEVDEAWLASIVPPDAVPLGFVAVASWLTEDGEQRWAVYSQLDLPLTGTLGLLELAKMELVRRTPGTFPGSAEG